MLPGSYAGLGKRIAVTGGAGDPIHQMHVRMVLALLSAVNPNFASLFDSVVWVLSGPSSFKQDLTSGIHRQQMALLAFPDQWHYKLTRWAKFYLDVSNAMYENLPTVELLARIKADNPGSTVSFVIGSDAVTPNVNPTSGVTTYPIQSWVGFDRLFNPETPDHFLVIPREGYLTPQSGQLPYDNMEWFTTEVYPAVSSSDIRKRIAAGDPNWIEYLPHRVVEYIKMYGLYQYVQSK